MSDLETFKRIFDNAGQQYNVSEKNYPEHPNVKFTMSLDPDLKGSWYHCEFLFDSDQKYLECDYGE